MQIFATKVALPAPNPTTAPKTKPLPAFQTRATLCLIPPQNPTKPKFITYYQGKHHIKKLR